jgi:hypothetical protein
VDEEVAIHRFGVCFSRNFFLTNACFFFMRGVIFLIASQALILGLWGCMDAVSTTQTLQAPGPGSVFEYEHWYTFASAPPEGPDSSYDSVIGIGLAFDGKADVLAEDFNVAGSSSVSWISYELNGDISWYAASPGASGDWERYPLTSKDTIIFVKGKNSLGNLVVDTNSFLEAKDTSIEGIQWHAIKIRQIVSLDGHTYNNEVLWFDSITGWYLGMDMPPRVAFEPGLSTNGEELDVYNYKIYP